MELFTYFHQSYALRLMSCSVFLFSLNILKPVRIEFQRCNDFTSESRPDWYYHMPMLPPVWDNQFNRYILGQPLRIRFLTLWRCVQHSNSNLFTRHPSIIFRAFLGLCVFDSPLFCGSVCLLAGLSSSDPIYHSAKGVLALKRVCRFV